LVGDLSLGSIGTETKSVKRTAGTEPRAVARGCQAQLHGADLDYFILSAQVELKASHQRSKAGLINIALPVTAGEGRNDLNGGNARYVQTVS
jgi:hypothetical protein